MQAKYATAGGRTLYDHGQNAVGRMRSEILNEMLRFSEIEEKHKLSHVVAAPGELPGSGILELDGPKTRLRLTMAEPFSFVRKWNGWFDLWLDRNGEKIFLHNALLVGETFAGSSAKDSESSILPNFIAFGAKHLARDGRLTTISCNISDLEYFFNYEMIEYQSLYKASHKFKRSLQEIRRFEKKYPREYEFYDPRQIILVHELPTALKFRVDDRFYEVRMGVRGSFGRTSLDLVAIPVASITFDQPVTLEKAVRHVWDWRRFFTQIALRRLPFESILARKKGRRKGYASIYLPGLQETYFKESGIYSFHPGAAPLNRWTERRDLMKVMKLWLEKQSARRVFRENLDDVIQEMHRRTTPDHVLKLASGIESLSELDATSLYSKRDIDTLVKAAANIAEETGIDIEAGRIRGVLGLLRKQNLSSRIRALSDFVEPVLSHNVAHMPSAVQKIRNATAHGSSSLESLYPRATETTRALAAMCAIWDLKTCGLPIEEAGGRTVPQLVAFEALQGIARMTAQR